MDRLAKIIILLILILVTYSLYLLSPTRLHEEKKVFVIPYESTQDKIVEKLLTENYIRSENAFRIINGLIKFPGIIEPGGYMISRSMNTYQIARSLQKNPYQKWILLVPGLRVEQISERLAKKFNWEKGKTDEFFLNAKEGYMFPDLYLLNIDYSGKETALRLISNFNEKFDEKLQADLLAQNVRIDTAIKIASLIERESGGDEDKALIAGIIWNRLNTNMRLQIDATSQYILGTSKNWWPRVSPADHKIDSPYNTYKIDGLPPTPISNPSLASIKAVVYPEETNCYFYIHDLGKKIHCAKSYEEHLANVEKYLKNN